MPYVEGDARFLLDESIEHLAYLLSLGNKVLDGEVNYAITKLLLETYGGPSYSIYNRMIGVLECVKLEMYRRAVVPYEEVKCAENGDVY